MAAGRVFCRLSQLLERRAYVDTFPSLTIVAKALQKHGLDVTLDTQLAVTACTNTHTTLTPVSPSKPKPVLRPRLAEDKEGLCSHGNSSRLVLSARALHVRQVRGLWVQRQRLHACRVRHLQELPRCVEHDYDAVPVVVLDAAAVLGTGYAHDNQAWHLLRAAVLKGHLRSHSARVIGLPAETCCAAQCELLTYQHINSYCKSRVLRAACMHTQVSDILVIDHANSIAMRGTVHGLPGPETQPGTQHEGQGPIESYLTI